MRPYSLDLRQRIVDSYDCGDGSIRDLAVQFGVDPSTVQRYRRRARETGGSPVPRPHAGGTPRRLQAPALAELRRLLAAANDLTDAEYAAALTGACGVHVSARTINRTWARLRITRKKKRPPRHRA